MTQAGDINKKLTKYLTLDESKSIDTSAICEMATITTDNKGQHLVRHLGVNPDSGRNWFNSEYFKVYDTPSVKDATKLARIKFRTPEYEEHVGSNWKLNSKEKKDLIKLLQEPNKKAPNIKTNWEYAILQFNLEAYEDSTFETAIITTKEQTELEDSDERKYYLPIDLPMPNYMEL